MDIKLLKDEIKRGLENLDKLAGLRDECTSLAWKRETEELRKSFNSEVYAAYFFFRIILKYFRV